MNSLRIAVVGLGKMGLVHASLLSSMPNVEIVGVCEKSYFFLKIVKKLFKTAKAVNDLEKLNNLNLDAVYVTTPIPSHSPIIKTLLSQHISKNIFVEKTLASDFKKSNELCDLVETTEGINMVGYMKRFAVTFARAKQILSENSLGTIASFDAYAYSSDFSNVDASSLKSGSRGGVLSDLGSHVIDLALWFFGDFKVESASLKSIIGGTWEDSADFTVKRPGLKGDFHISWCKDEYRLPSFGLTIKGESGIMEINDYTVQLKLTDRDPQIWFRQNLNDNVSFLIGDSEYCREDEAFVNSVLTGDKAEPSFRTASKVDEVIDQVKREGKQDGS
jgi:predicted dehydrogenase